jgi:serine-type D-Ala-D-Ala carboxypeptidase/endopeptidase
MRGSNLPVLLLAIQVTVASPIAAQPSSAPSDSTILAVIKSRVDAGLAPGIVVGFLDPDGRRRIVVYGRSGTARPLDGNTVFEIGSVTKTLTATLLADMALRGELTLDDPIAKHLPPGATVPPRAGREITLLDLVTHTSGLPRDPNNRAVMNLLNPDGDYGPDNLYALLGSHRLRRDIGSEYEYSNVGFMTLSDIVTRRAGAAAYEDVLVRRLLQPLGMKDTRVVMTPDMQSRFAQGHDTGLYPTPPWTMHPRLAGLGMLKSTANDMLTYLAANLDAERNPRRSGVAAAMYEAHRDRRAADTGRVALAWSRRVLANGDTLLYHGGGTGGYRSLAAFVPARGTAVIMLVNAAPLSYDVGLHLIAPEVPLTPASRPAWAIGPTVAVAPDVLERYVGTYERPDGTRFTITHSADSLFTTSGVIRRQLLARSEDFFFARGAPVRYRFQQDGAGQVTSILIENNGTELVARRQHEKNDLR